MQSCVFLATWDLPGQADLSPRSEGPQGLSRCSSRTTSTDEAVLKKMEEWKRMCRLRGRGVREGRICSIAQRIKTCETPSRKAASGQENEYLEDDEDGGDDDDDREKDEEAELDEEADCDEEDGEFSEVRQKNAKFQKSRKNPPKVFHHHASSTRGSYCISASVPRSAYTTSGRRGRLGPTLGRRKHTWHPRRDSVSSEEKEDSDEEHGGKTSCLPVNLRKEDILGIHSDRMKIQSSLADIDPMVIDQSVRFDSVGGLTSHISALKEMVVFPLLYPEVFDKFKIQPPRGCLFYGPPGTGKTLVARALANECSQGDRKVAFFMRKGADCLSKWVGESERQLRLLFDQAYQMRPSIIFFDEIDGLAPVRSSRQDQIHSSIVSTLLALMDGMDSRGEVVVIGATNRLDAIDPALRRPGRFDREFLFGLPDRESRRDILKIHTHQWCPAPSDTFLEELADKCVGYCGADIKAVCAEAALCALRRRYPQIYASSQKLLLDVSSISVSATDFLAAMAKTVAASQRAVSSPAKALAPALAPLLGSELTALLDGLQKLFPHAEQGLRKRRDASDLLEDDLLYSGDEGTSSNTSISKQTPPSKGSFLHLARSAAHQPTSHRPRLLLTGRPGAGQSAHLAPAMLHALERFSVYTLDVAVLFGVSSTSPEEACAQVFCEARRTSPSILYVPRIQRWWDTVGPALKATFTSLLHDLPSFSPVLLLATSDQAHHDLDDEVQALFRVEHGEVHSIRTPTQQERRRFYEDLILFQAAKAPASKKKALMQAMEVLPLAPPPPPRQMSERERLRMEEKEEDTLRELRLFLRSVTERLAQDKRFRAFSRPVDVEEVPDYTTVIKTPMDLSTVLANVDSHKYVTVREFANDVDLIWKNALEYNPDSDPSDRQIRHRACALKDTLHAIIRDELDEDFDMICEQIRNSRNKRGCKTSMFAPSCYQTLPRGEGCSDDRRPNGKDASTPFAANAPRPTKRRGGRVTRATWTVAQQQQVIDVDKALEILSQKSPQLVVDHDKLKDLLKRVVTKTEGYEVCQLEKLYALLCQSIYRHRKKYDKTELVQDLKSDIDNFC
ncbi:ATPase family AAA domain-containing protein 2-like isoform X1 [Hypomesus transpacificus]|uniref:ATPase family AAA domain-containing protein 2-like isoform X1 n=1 Tax=Hypomesus transpacificus TaxID=137520 RepID=UPI001F076DCB|nr:ATPase family AAA domain-containing protein 2-like isoform X1 [Hypomesus transpacificus]